MSDGIRNSGPAVTIHGATLPAPDYRDARIAELEAQLRESEAERERWRKMATDPSTSAHPDKCPVTGLPFFMTIEHPERGTVATYGGPFDSYTIPERDPEDNNQFFRERYDHDRGAWIGGTEAIGVYAVTEDELAEHAEVKAEVERLARELAEAQNHMALLKQALGRGTDHGMCGEWFCAMCQYDLKQWIIAGCAGELPPLCPLCNHALDAARSGGQDAH